jgi:hypothetical protein
MDNNIITQKYKKLYQKYKYKYIKLKIKKTIIDLSPLPPLPMLQLSNTNNIISKSYIIPRTENNYREKNINSQFAQFNSSQFNLTGGKNIIKFNYVNHMDNCMCFMPCGT